MPPVKKAKQIIKSIVRPGQDVGTHNEEYREAWLKAAIAKIPAGLRILDAGAGELRYKPYCEHLEYTSQDLGKYDGQGDDAGLHTKTWDNSKLDIVSDIIKIPVKDKSFDAVMCVEVFEHIPRPVEAIKEFARIIKPGGYLVLTTPTFSLTHFAPFYFYSGYSRYFFETILREYGFDHIEVEPSGNYFESVAQEVRRIDEVGVKYTVDAPAAHPLYRWANRLVLERLQQLSAADEGSSELLSHGMHVTARRKKEKTR